MAVEKTVCCRCRCRNVRTIDDDSGAHEAEDGLCIDCDLNHFDDVEISGAEDIATTLRTVVANLIPTDSQLANAIGPRTNLAKYYVELAAKNLVAAANLIHGDGWVPDFPSPSKRSASWVEKK